MRVVQTAVIQSWRATSTNQISIRSKQGSKWFVLLTKLLSEHKKPVRIILVHVCEFIHEPMADCANCTDDRDM